MKIMGKLKESEPKNPGLRGDDEDEATLAAVDEGVRDARAGRLFSMEEVRKLLPKRITASSSRKER